MSDDRRPTSDRGLAEPRLSDENAAKDPDQPADAAEAAQAAELSRAAREAVRQPADPRIERQLARMGLAPDDAPGESSGPTDAAATSSRRGAADEEVAALRSSVDALRASADEAASRIRSLTLLAVIEAVVIVILVVVLLTR